MGRPSRIMLRHGLTSRSPRLAEFLLLVSLALSALLVLLSGCGTPAFGGSAAVGNQAPSVRSVPVQLAQAPAITTTVRSARRRLYPFASSNVGLMQPVVDAQGHVWVGEMHVNRLGSLDAKTGTVTNRVPPGGRYGIMATAVDAQGGVWFAELYANYLGRFDSRQQTFRLFPLGTWRGSPLGPQSVQVDRRGMLWFTAAEARAIGRLDPETGTIHLWPVPSTPSALTLTPTGRVWVGLAGALGSLDPTTNQLILYRLPNSETQVFELATDRAGRLWFTEVLPGTLGLFDPTTGTLTELPVPAFAGRSAVLFALVIDRAGMIWFVDGGAGTLVCYAPARSSLTFIQLSLPASAPFGLTLDASGKLWFTAGGSSANSIGEMTP